MSNPHQQPYFPGNYPSPPNPNGGPPFQYPQANNFPQQQFYPVGNSNNTVANMPPQQQQPQQPPQLQIYNNGNNMPVMQPHLSPYNNNNNGNNMNMNNISKNNQPLGPKSPSHQIIPPAQGMSPQIVPGYGMPPQQLQQQQPQYYPPQQPNPHLNPQQQQHQHPQQQQQQQVYQDPLQVSDNNLYFGPPPTVNVDKSKELEPIMKFKDYIVDLNNFTNKSALGTGSFGTVSKAINKYTGWKVAIKELITSNLPAKQIEFFKREVSILVACNDPFLLDFVGFTIEPPLAIVTSFMSQGSLWDILHKYPGKISPTQKTNIAIGIAHGMRYLHSKGIIHRDLKSPNILLDDRLLPRVGDFGLGRIIDKANEGQPPMTSCAGTPNWMAPEQIFTHDYGFAVDVYSYGMILYELASEHYPFEGKQSPEIFNLVQNKCRPELPESIKGTSLAELITVCWDQSPEKRPTFDYIYNMFSSRNVEFPGTSDSGVKSMFHYITQTDLNRSKSISADQVNEIIRIRKEYYFTSQPSANNGPLSATAAPTSNSNANTNINNGALPSSSGSNGAQTTSRTAKMLCMCANSGNIDEFIKYFTALPDSDVNCTDPDNTNRTPLHCAAYNGYTAMVQFLTGINGINVNLTDQCQDTPLSIAVQLKRREVTQILLNCPGIDPNIPNKYGATPLHYATVYEDIETVRLLLRTKNIDVNQKDTNKYTAQDMANQSNNKEILSLLKAAVASRRK